MKSILTLTILSLTMILVGCSSTESKDELMATGGMLANSEGGEGAPPVISIPEPGPSEPFATPQAFETVEIMRELQKHGCLISNFKRTNSVHWQQLHLSCSAPLPLPGE